MAKHLPLTNGTPRRRASGRCCTLATSHDTCSCTVCRTHGGVESKGTFPQSHKNLASIVSYCTVRPSLQLSHTHATFWCALVIPRFSLFCITLPLRI
jgi:hypothetical protein